jgi:hypothetical protein
MGMDMANIPGLRAVLLHDLTLSAGYSSCRNIPQTHKVPYCYYKLVIGVIRAVKTIVIAVVYGLIKHIRKVFRPLDFFHILLL